MFETRQIFKISSMEIIVLICSLLIGWICPFYYVISFFCNFFVARRLRLCYSLYNNSKVILTKKKYLHDHLLIEIKAFVLCFFCFWFIPLVFVCILDEQPFVNLVKENMLIFIITLFIWIGIFSLRKLTESEKFYLSSSNNLTLGYGAAIWYYKNYLYRILPEKFLERVQQFEKKEGVKLPHKLYILFPKSCKVKNYIDITDFIEGSKELPSHTINHGGIVRRPYNISVYKIKYNGEFFRCALEYAQPLKNLLAMKENGKISLSEMYIERETFINKLTQMLKDHKNSFEVCELVDYDDTKELHQVLSDLSSVQPLKHPATE